MANSTFHTEKKSYEKNVCTLTVCYTAGFYPYRIRFCLIKPKKKTCATTSCAVYTTCKHIQELI